MANYSSRYSPPKNAHEIALRAREFEKRQAIMVAEMRAEEKSKRETRGLIESLLTSLRIF